jgi:hypothetical protein
LIGSLFIIIITYSQIVRSPRRDERQFWILLLILIWLIKIKHFVKILHPNLISSYKIDKYPFLSYLVSSFFNFISFSLLSHLSIYLQLSPYYYSASLCIQRRNFIFKIDYFLRWVHLRRSFRAEKNHPRSSSTYKNW